MPYSLTTLFSLYQRTPAIGQGSTRPSGTVARTVPMSAQHPLPAWPGSASMMAARQARGASEWLKTWWRGWRSQSHRPVLLGALARHPVWAARFGQEPRYFHCVQSHQVDRRLAMGQRIEALARDISAADLVFGPALAPRIASGEQVRLASVAAAEGGLHICLGLNDCSYHEGVWALSLRDDLGRRLYYMSLSFGSTRSVLVPTVQGPTAVRQHSADDDNRELLRRITKAAQGLRPPALLMAGLRSACAAWGIDHLAGIAPQHHVKGRWNLRASRLRFDYQLFWREQGGYRAADGNWTLPTQQAQRPLSEVPTQKRAMYRRRQALLASLDGAIADQLSQRDLSEPPRLAD